MIDPCLLGESIVLGKLKLSHLLLRDDSRFPWLMLVPDRPHLKEWDDLSAQDRSLLTEEVALVCQGLRFIWPEVKKTNVGALGNIVSQLHIHVIGRHKQDLAWPGPVWGSGGAVSYSREILEEKVKKAQDFFLT